MRRQIGSLADGVLGRMLPGIRACACRCYTQYDQRLCRHRRCCTCASGTVCDGWVKGC